jgi:hypothetical protein
VERQYEKTRKMTARIELGSDDEFEWAALGYTIHNYYNALENYFSRISKFFDNELDSASWHRDLVDRMTLSIEGVRPRLLPPSIRRQVHELRSFRHVVRNLYDSELDPERVGRINSQLPEIMKVMIAAHSSFYAKIVAVAERLET